MASDNDIARCIFDEELAELAKRNQRFGPLEPHALVEELLRVAQHRRSAREQIAFADAQAQHHRAPAYLNEDPRTVRGVKLALAWECITRALTTLNLMTRLEHAPHTEARLSKANQASLLLVSGEYRDQATAHIRASGVRTISEALAGAPLPN